MGAQGEEPALIEGWQRWVLWRVDLQPVRGLAGSRSAVAVAAVALLLPLPATCFHHLPRQAVTNPHYSSVHGTWSASQLHA